MSERDIEREGLGISVSNDSNLTETDKVYNRDGDTYTTVAYKAPDGRLYTTDKGFDYNAGRMNYRPDLDKYDRALAHQFAKAEMTGAEFKAAFKRIETDQAAIKQRLGIDAPDNEQKKQLQQMMSHKLRFAAGVLSKDVQQAGGFTQATVWLSDDTLNKQFASRAKNKTPFDLAFYEKLPDILHEPDYVVRNQSDDWFIREANDKILVAALKYLDKPNEIFLVSFREGKKAELNKILLTKEVKYQKK